MATDMVRIREGYIAALVEQVARDEQTLRDSDVPHPGLAFYEQRIAEYKLEVKRLRDQHAQEGT